MTNFDKVKKNLEVKDLDFTSYGIESNCICNIIHKIKGEVNCASRGCLECKEWLMQEEDVLDIKEKEYLRLVLKPFRKQIKYIMKDMNNDNSEYIEVCMKNDDVLIFPSFRDDNMYKNMEIGKEYKLKELGL